MQNFRAGLDAKGRRLASAGEACALFSALSCFVFAFLTGLRGGGGRSFLLWDCFAVRTAGGAFALCAALTALLSVCVLFALTVLRYVRFLLGKSKKDSLYFCYATFAAYLAGIMLFAMCAADGTYRLNGATVAGLCLGGAGTAASLVLFLTAKKEGGREAASRYTSGAFSLAAVLMLFALFSTGLVTDGDRRGLVWLYQDSSLPDGGTAAVLCFLFLIAFAACAVLLFERLLGGIAQRRKPTCLRAVLTAVFASAAALCERYAAAPPDEMRLIAVWGVPAVIMILSALMLAAVCADTFYARRAADNTQPGKEDKI